jgi:tetratricopeptide (TPR) repeat protein
MDALTGDDFPARRTSMRASSFRSLRCKLFFAVVLVSPIASLAQSDSKSFSNNYSISVRDLKLDGKGRAAFAKGSRMLDKGDTTGSIPYLERAISESPEHYKAYYDLGVAHFRLGHLPEAEQAFQKTIDLTGGSFAPPQFGLGAVLCKKREFLLAETILRRGIELEAGSPVGKYYLAWAQLGLNRLVEAERSAEEALARNANLAEAYLLLARIHQRQQNAPAVAKDLEVYLKLEGHKELARRLADEIRQEMAQTTTASVSAAIRP